jgi:DNA helicase II / ATP-dependent DNA helicase PcrA
VLYRTNAQARALEDALIRAGIPYRILAGSRFYERPEVRHALAYLRLALDQTDDRAAATLFGDVRGVGDVRLDEFRDAAGGASVSLLDFALHGGRPHAVPKAVWQRVREAAERAEGVVARRASRLPEVVQAAVQATLADLGGRERVPDEVAETLEELRSLAGELYGARGTVRGLVDRTSMASESAQAAESVNLLSLHAAKGLEFDAVFIAGLEEGLLPHRRSLESDDGVEEERRLLYVGMTRARDVLALSHARMRFLGGNAMTGGPSRFLGEIGAANLRSEGSTRAAERPRLGSVRAGDQVQHQRWGAGTVVSVEGRGRDTMTTIHFETVGRQRLQLIHAPLMLLRRADDH